MDFNNYKRFSDVAHIFRGQNIAWGKKTKPMNNFVYDGNIYLYYCANLLAYFPLSKDDQGVVRLRYQSFHFIYAIAFLMLTHGFGYFTMRTVLTNLWTKNFSFLNGLRYVCLIVTPLVNFLPTMALLETSKLAAHFVKWEEFQERYQGITGKMFPIAPSSIWRAVSLIVLLLTITLYFLISVHNLSLYEVYGLDVDIHKYFFYYSMYSPISLICYLIVWVSLTGALKDAADLILSDVEALRWTARKSLQGHIVLWTQLRGLCVGLGDALFYSNFCYCASVFIISLPLMYIGAVTAREGRLDELTPSILSLTLISALAEVSYRAVNKVGDGFQKKLSHLLSNPKTQGCEGEVILFIQTVASNPPAISVAGLFNLDRSVNISLYSSVLTYLIILIQFQGS